MTAELGGRRIVVPETRELDLLARMIEERGGEAVRCPLVAIRDVEDATPVEAWLKRFAGGACHDLVLLTGEGLRRLMGVAQRAGLDEGFLAALGKARKVTRGPKPVRALRELGLNADIAAETPTTDGVIAALSRHDLAGRSVGVQLYPEADTRIADFLAGAGATADPVLPYAYATAADDARVIAVLDEMAAGGIDAIAFTSSPQVRRLRDIAAGAGREAALRAALERLVVAAIGPVVAAELAALGARVDVTPAGDTFFMKPLVRALAEKLGPALARNE